MRRPKSQAGGSRQAGGSIRLQKRAGASASTTGASVRKKQEGSAAALASGEQGLKNVAGEAGHASKQPQPTQAEETRPVVAEVAASDQDSNSDAASDVASPAPRAALVAAATAAASAATPKASDPAAAPVAAVAKPAKPEEAVAPTAAPASSGAKPTEANCLPAKACGMQPLQQAASSATANEASTTTGADTSQIKVVNVTTETGAVNPGKPASCVAEKAAADHRICGWCLRRWRRPEAIERRPPEAIEQHRQMEDDPKEIRCSEAETIHDVPIVIVKYVDAAEKVVSTRLEEPRASEVSARSEFWDAFEHEKEYKPPTRDEIRRLLSQAKVERNEAYTEYSDTQKAAAASTAANAAASTRRSIDTE